MKLAIPLLIILATISCKSPINDNLLRIPFKIPFVVSKNDTINIEEQTDSCNRAWNLVLGKQKFTDTLRITGRIPSRVDSGYVPFHQMDSQLDSFSINGLQIAVDYKSTIVGNSKNLLFPVYIFNETATPKILPVVSDEIKAIMEALDSNKRWRPIQFAFTYGYWICGNSFGGVRLNPNEFATVLFNKYDGNFDTKLRIRMRLNDYILLSQPFDGKINYSQFYVEGKGRLHFALVYNYYGVVSNVFYGASPLGYKEPMAMY